MMFRQQEVLENARQSMADSEMVERARAMFRRNSTIYGILGIVIAVATGLSVGYATEQVASIFLVPLGLMTIWGVVVWIKSPTVPTNCVSFIEVNGIPLKPISAGFTPCLWPVTRGSKTVVPLAPQMVSALINIPNSILYRDDIPSTRLNSQVKITLATSVSDPFRYAYGLTSMEYLKSCMGGYLGDFLHRTLEGSKGVDGIRLLSTKSNQMVLWDIKNSEVGQQLLGVLRGLGLELEETQMLSVLS